MATNPITRGHQRQVMLVDPNAVELPPRLSISLDVARNKGMVGKWYYAKDLETMLSMTTYGYKYSAFEMLKRERGAWWREKTGVPRRVSELIGRTLGKDEAVLEFSSGSNKSGILEVITRINFSFGALGVGIEQFPVPGLQDRYAIVKVRDPGEVGDLKILLKDMCYEIEQNLQANAPMSRRVPSSLSNIKNYVPVQVYRLDCYLHHDPDCGINCAPLESISNRVPDPPPLPTTGELRIGRQQAESRAEQVAKLEQQLKELVASLAASGKKQ